MKVKFLKLESLTPALIETKFAKVWIRLTGIIKKCGDQVIKSIVYSSVVIQMIVKKK